MNLQAAGRDLACNLLAGTRLALFMPVTLQNVRTSGSHYATLVVASFILWFLGGMAREGFPGAVNPGALTVGLAQIPIVLLFCLLAAGVLRNAGYAMAFATLLVATDPLFEVVATAIYHLARTEQLVDFAPYFNQAFLLWALATILRVQWVVAGWQGARSLGAALLFAVMLTFFAFGFPRSELWSSAVETGSSPNAEGLIREELFHLQGRMLGEQLAEIEPERPGVDDLYFVGAAPYAFQDTFVNELDVVRRLVDERFDTTGRSIALSNHVSTLSSLPLATVSNLRSVLGFLGETINPEEDIVFLHLATQGMANDLLSFEMPPLALTQLNPTILARMLADSGIKWKVIVVSACYSGGFLEPLRDDNTLIITASDAATPSYGCEPGSNFSWFSEAYFNQALRATRSFIEGFALARNALLEREKTQGVTLSNPQIHVGAGIKAKLETLERRLDSSDPGRPAVHAGSRSKRVFRFL